MSINTFRFTPSSSQGQLNNNASTKGLVSWTQVQNMVREYWNNTLAPKVRIQVGETEETVRLDGLSFDISDIQTIINNAGGIENLSKLFIMFGVDQNDFNKPDTEQGFTTILVGIDDNNCILTSTAVDFAQPCPDICPSKYKELISTNNYQSIQCP